jgi:hypothetical protein
VRLLEEMIVCNREELINLREEILLPAWNKWVTFIYLFYRCFFLINIRVQTSLRASQDYINF